MLDPFPHFRLARNLNPTTPPTVSIRCPHCGHNGSFHSPLGKEDLSWTVSRTDERSGYVVGIRGCPNSDCLGVVFIVLKDNRLWRSFPAELKEFDTTGLPSKVRASMAEAIKCEAQQCYRAAALMIRRTIEDLCEDRGAKGKNLAERIDALGKHIIIPRDLLQGAHELRFLGNDAAHVEAQEYADVGKEEIDAAIDLAKALLSATYQTSSLVERLRALKVKAGQQPPQGG